MKKILSWIGAVLALIIGILAVNKFSRNIKRVGMLEEKAAGKAKENTQEAFQQAKKFERKAEEAREEAKTAKVKARNRITELEERGNEDMASRIDRLNRL